MGYKVPFRQVWALTFRDWVRETIWCHVVLRLYGDYIDQMACTCGSYGVPGDSASPPVEPDDLQ